MIVVVLPLFLLVLGAVFIYLGVSKKLFLDGLGTDGLNAVGLIFFLYGFLHLAVATFFMIAPIPYGALTQANESWSFVTTAPLVNTTEYYANGTVWKIVEVINQTVTSKANSVSFAYETGGGDIMWYFFLFDILVLTLYLLLLAVTWFARMWGFNKR